MQISTNASRINVEGKQNRHKTLVAVTLTELVLTRAIVVVKISFVGKI